MNLGIVCDISNKKPIGVIAIDNKNGDIGYIVNNNELEDDIEVILNHKELTVPVQEVINSNYIIRQQTYTIKDNNYLTAFNYYLPQPWRILGLKDVDGDMEQILNESYNHMEGIK
jgi:hypothetical protein